MDNVSGKRHEVETINIKFELLVHCIRIPRSVTSCAGTVIKALPDDTSISVCFERKGQQSCTDTFVCKKPQAALISQHANSHSKYIEVAINQKVAITVRMHRDKNTGRYQPGKIAKLYYRVAKKSFFVTTHESMAFAELQLDSLILPPHLNNLKVTVQLTTAGLREECGGPKTLQELLSPKKANSAEAAAAAAASLEVSVATFGDEEARTVVSQKLLLQRSQSAKKASVLSTSAVARSGSLDDGAGEVINEYRGRHRESPQIGTTTAAAFSSSKLSAVSADALSPPPATSAAPTLSMEPAAVYATPPSKTNYAAAKAAVVVAVAAGALSPPGAQKMQHVSSPAGGYNGEYTHYSGPSPSPSPFASRTPPKYEGGHLPVKVRFTLCILNVILTEPGSAAGGEGGGRSGKEDKSRKPVPVVGDNGSILNISLVAGEAKSNEHVLKEYNGCAAAGSGKDECTMTKSCVSSSSCSFPYVRIASTQQPQQPPPSPPFKKYSSKGNEGTSSSSSNSSSLGRDAVVEVVCSGFRKEVSLDVDMLRVGTTRNKQPIFKPLLGAVKLSMTPPPSSSSTTTSTSSSSRRTATGSDNIVLGVCSLDLDSFVLPAQFDNLKITVPLVAAGTADTAATSGTAVMNTGSSVKLMDLLGGDKFKMDKLLKQAQAKIVLLLTTKEVLWGDERKIGGGGGGGEKEEPAAGKLEVASVPVQSPNRRLPATAVPTAVAGLKDSGGGHSPASTTPSAPSAPPPPPPPSPSPPSPSPLSQALPSPQEKNPPPPPAAAVVVAPAVPPAVPVAAELTKVDHRHPMLSSLSMESQAVHTALESVSKSILAAAVVSPSPQAAALVTSESIWQEARKVGGSLLTEIEAQVLIELLQVGRYYQNNYNYNSNCAESRKEGRHGTEPQLPQESVMDEGSLLASYKMLRQRMTVFLPGEKAEGKGEQKEEGREGGGGGGKGAVAAAADAATAPPSARSAASDLPATSRSNGRSLKSIIQQHNKSSTFLLKLNAQLRLTSPAVKALSAEESERILADIDFAAKHYLVPGAVLDHLIVTFFYTAEASKLRQKPKQGSTLAQLTIVEITALAALILLGDENEQGYLATRYATDSSSEHTRNVHTILTAAGVPEEASRGIERRTINNRAAAAAAEEEEEELEMDMTAGEVRSRSLCITRAKLAVYEKLRQQDQDQSQLRSGGVISSCPLSSSLAIEDLIESITAQTGHPQSEVRTIFTLDSSVAQRVLTFYKKKGAQSKVSSSSSSTSTSTSRNDIGIKSASSESCQSKQTEEEEDEEGTRCHGKILSAGCSTSPSSSSSSALEALTIVEVGDKEAGRPSATSSSTNTTTHGDGSSPPPSCAAAATTATVAEKQYERSGNTKKQTKKKERKMERAARKRRGSNLSNDLSSMAMKAHGDVSKGSSLSPPSAAAAAAAAGEEKEKNVYNSVPLVCISSTFGGRSSSSSSSNSNSSSSDSRGLSMASVDHTSRMGERITCEICCCDDVPRVAIQQCAHDVCFNCIVKDVSRQIRVSGTTREQSVQSNPTSTSTSTSTASTTVAIKREDQVSTNSRPNSKAVPVVGCPFGCKNSSVPFSVLLKFKDLGLFSVELWRDILVRYNIYKKGQKLLACSRTCGNLIITDSAAARVVCNLCHTTLCVEHETVMIYMSRENRTTSTSSTTGSSVVADAPATAAIDDALDDINTGDASPLQKKKSKKKVGAKREEEEEEEAAAVARAARAAGGGTSKAAARQNNNLPKQKQREKAQAEEAEEEEEEEECEDDGDDGDDEDECGDNENRQQQQQEQKQAILVCPACVHRNDELDQQSKEFLDKEKAVSQACTQCNTLISKDEGCMHMTCAACKHSFYWCCLRKYGDREHDRDKSCNAKYPRRCPDCDKKTDWCGGEHTVCYYCKYEFKWEDAPFEE